MGAALTLPGLLPPEHLRQKLLSQWHTPDATAQKLANWCGSPPVAWRILEPSAGAGALVNASLRVIRGPHIDAVEIDPVYADKLRARFADERVSVECCDYLGRAAPESPYDLCIANPPYEGGLDGAFLSKCMDESKRVVALVRLTTLAGKERHRSVWSRIECGEWSFTGLAVFASRPVFLAAGDDVGGGKTDFAAVKLSRTYGDRQERETAVEWWT